MLTYFRCDWRHFRRHEPILIYYEVDPQGRVLRIIDIFADGAVACIALADYAGREHELPGEGSLVEGAFHDAVAHLLEGHKLQDRENEMTMAPTDAAQFETAWRRGAADPGTA